MARIKKRRKRKIGKTDSESMDAAVRKVIDEGMGIRSTCKAYDIKFSTLPRYVKKANAAEDKELMTYAPNYNCRQVFTTNEEILLQDYLIKAAKIQYGLTRKQVRVLAYEYAVRNQKTFPDSWTTHGLAGEDWFTRYMKRFPNISLRCPRATSLSRATSFNKKNVKEFYDNLEQVMEKNHFSPNDIYNADETGCTTGQKVGNTKVIACRKKERSHQEREGHW